ncbi:MAG: hypothetical protein JNL54_16160 [Kineosporiaceae bacterium]|nr:hypothetical protein [Kineosporiaceae bacterium]
MDTAVAGVVLAAWVALAVARLAGWPRWLPPRGAFAHHIEESRARTRKLKEHR